ncbi:MAG TPA: hypothetical protein EYN66_06450, partial [Myxococcales bacterium]|nr:hypothetical protein [Myxococcales bacterium]
MKTMRTLAPVFPTAPPPDFWEQPCDGHDDCISKDGNQFGYCVPTADGSKHCSIGCIENCPEGYSCSAVLNPGGSDYLFVCTPDDKSKPIEVTEIACKSDADCEQAATDIGPCKQALCSASDAICIIANRAEGAPCSSGDACTHSEVCISGSCSDGVALDCNDDNPCTENNCHSETGCVSTNIDGKCDDANQCTDNDQCNAGVCSGTPGKECKCETNKDCEELEDEDLCNGTLVCNGGQCVVDASSLVQCEDSICSITSCNPKNGQCETELSDDGSACDDSDNCTTLDSCQAGVCIGGDNICDSCTNDLECSVVDDGDLCNGVPKCVEGQCVTTQDSVVVCPVSDNPCIANSCIPDSGVCEASSQADGTQCSDGDLCTV